MPHPIHDAMTDEQMRESLILYRDAYKKEAERAEYWYNQCQSLKIQAGIGGLVYLQDIANMAGVTTTTVTTWRYRYADSETPFPLPQSTRKGNTPLWERAKVIEWLEKTGRPYRKED